MASAHCPDCDLRIVLNPHAKLGQELACPHCDADLEVIGVDPLQLDWADAWTWENEKGGVVQTGSLA